MPNLYSVSMSTTRAIPYLAIHKELQSADDWIAFSPWHYFVISEKGPQDISNMFRAHLYPDDFIFVAQVDRQKIWGWLPGNLVEWINRPRAPKFTLVTDESAD